MKQIDLENRISDLRDERSRNGWNSMEASNHEELMDVLRSNFPESKYLK